MNKTYSYLEYIIFFVFFFFEFGGSRESSQQIQEIEEIGETRSQSPTYVLYNSLPISATLRSAHQSARFYMLSEEMATGKVEWVEGGVAKQSLEALDLVRLGRARTGRQMANPKGIVSSKVSSKVSRFLGRESSQ